jgi:hypothetical protein
VKYVGGPLDGQQAQRTGSVWSLFRRPDGSYLESTNGRRLLAVPAAKRRSTRKSGYMLVWWRNQETHYRWIEDI